MTDNIILGIRVQPNQYQRIKLNNVNLEDKVEYLKNEAAKQINSHKQNIELVYCGLILDDDSSLSACGVKSGVTVHVLEKKVPTSSVKPKKLNETDIQQLVVAFRTLCLTSGYRAALQKLSRSEVLDNIVSATPGLAEDPIAISMIRDPELVIQMTDLQTVRKIAELHPSLIEAAHRIAAFVNEEATAGHHNQATTSSGYSYSLEALSDDEDMESPNESSHEAAPLARNSSYNAITAAQLAAAIANATSSSGFGNYPPRTTTPTGGSGNIITSEMFSNAMQQAFASSQTSSQSPSVIGGIGETFEAMTRRWQPQLQQMNEMGLVNEAVNIRALQTTSGDVQAAIELVLSGAFD